APSARAPAREGRHRRRADRVLAWGFLLWAPANAVLVESRREASAKLFRDEKPRRGRPEAGFCVGHPRCRRANENPAPASRPTAERDSEIPRGPWVGGCRRYAGELHQPYAVHRRAANNQIAPLTVRQPLRRHAARLGRCIDAQGTFHTPLGRASVPPDPTLRNADAGTGRASYYKGPRALPSYSSSGNNSALDFPSRNHRSTAGHRSGIPCRASQRHPRNALPISSSALRLSTPRASSASTVSRTSSFSRIKLRATLAISLLGPGMG